jgi:hypothetical protein
MDLLERAPVLDELDGVLATATTGGRVVLLCASQLQRGSTCRSCSGSAVNGT